MVKVILVKSAFEEGEESREPQPQFLQGNADFPLCQEVPKLHNQANPLHIYNLKSCPKLLYSPDFVLFFDPQPIRDLNSRQHPSLEESLDPQLPGNLALELPKRHSKAIRHVQFGSADMDEPKGSISLVDSDLLFTVIWSEGEVDACQTWHELGICGFHFDDIEEVEVVEAAVGEADIADHLVEVGHSHAHHYRPSEDVDVIALQE